MDLNPAYLNIKTYLVCFVHWDFLLPLVKKKFKTAFLLFKLNSLKKNLILSGTDTPSGHASCNGIPQYDIFGNSSLVGVDFFPKIFL